MPERVQVKVHPDVQVENNVPDSLPKETYIIGHRTSLFIDGQFVLKLKVSMLIRKDGETDPTYAYSRYMRFGFLPPPTKEEFYQVCAYCYYTAIIEFNKSLDTVFKVDRFMDARFISEDAIKKMVDTALNPLVN